MQTPPRETYMEITSPPAYLDETVTDLDIGYVTGSRSETLRAADRFIEDDTKLEIFTAEPPQHLTYYKAPMLWLGRRTRILRTPIKNVTPNGAAPARPD
jgi:hypothetical protein